MKTHNRTLLFGMLILLFFPACEEDPRELNRFLIMGDLNAPGLIYYDFAPEVVIDPDLHSSKNEMFDINFDGISDFYISCSNFETAKSSFINSLSDDVEIASHMLTDTLVRYEDTLNDTLFFYTVNYDPAVHQHGSLQLTNNPIVKMYSVQDTVSTDILWHFFPTFVNEQKHVSFFGNQKFIYHVKLGTWNEVSDKYVAFRMYDKGDVLYGWLKISVSDYNRVTVHEFAYKSIVVK